MKYFDEFENEHGYDWSQFDDFGIVVPEEEKEKSCCFTGHRNIPKNSRENLLHRLRTTVLYLVNKGVTIFHAGGAMGFDTIAATTIIDLKRTHPQMKLVLDLPYENQTDGWTKDNVRIYEFIKSNADKVTYYSDNPKSKDQAVRAMFKRNRVLVDSASVCVCFCQKKRGGTAYTIDYASKCDLEIINLAQ